MGAANRLAQQPKKRRIHKSQREYAAKEGNFERAWRRIMLGEARRFQQEFVGVLSSLQP